MAKQRLKLIVSSPAWRAKGRYKINENVSYSGKNWQNSTGINSEPGIGSDWVEVGGGGGGNFYPMTGNSDTNPVTGDLYIKGNIVSQTSTTASGVTTTKEYDIDSMGTYAREEVFGGGSDIVRQVETDIYNGFGHIIENGSNTKSIIVTAELGVVADHYIDKEDDPFAYPQMQDIANAVGDFIPLSGTEAGNPVTGDVIFEGDGNSSIKFKNPLYDPDNPSGTESEFTLEIFEDGGVGVIKSYVGDSYIAIENGKILAVSDLSEVSIQNDRIVATSYLPPLNNFTYVQKKYVDDKILYGSEEFSFDGTQGTFLINHGMVDLNGDPVKPSSFALTFSDGGNVDFIQGFRTIDETDITIETSNAPLSGTITVFWQVFR